MPQLFCPHCGQPHPDDAVFCPATGQAMPSRASFETERDLLEDVGRTLKQAFTLYRRQARALLLVCSVAFVPAALAKCLAVAWLHGPWLEAPWVDEPFKILAGFLTSLLLYGVALPLSLGALTIAVGDLARGGVAGPREVWMFLFRRLGPLVVTVFLSGLAVALGFLCFVIPGLVLSLLFAFVSPVVLLERKSGVAALRRSRDLVKSDWMRVALVLIALGVLRWGAKLVASLVIPAGSPFISGLFGDLLTLVSMPVPVLGLVLTYEDIRKRREGPADDLARELAQLRRFGL